MTSCSLVKTTLANRVTLTKPLSFTKQLSYSVACHGADPELQLLVRLHAVVVLRVSLLAFIARRQSARSCSKLT